MIKICALYIIFLEFHHAYMKMLNNIHFGSKEGWNVSCTLYCSNEINNFNFDCNNPTPVVHKINYEHNLNNVPKEKTSLEKVSFTMNTSFDFEFFIIQHWQKRKFNKQGQKPISAYQELTVYTLFYHLR